MSSLRDRIKKKTAGVAGPPQKPPEPLVDQGPAKAHPPQPQEKSEDPAHATERKREESEEHIILKHTTSRIIFGRVLSPGEAGDCGHGDGYIIGLGQRPKHAKGTLRAVGSQKDDDGDGIFPQLTAALMDLRLYPADDRNGPYADHDGLLASFADKIFGDEGTMIGMIERVIDTRPFIDPDSERMFPRLHQHPYQFHFNQDFIVPDELIDAGRLLAQGRRLVPVEATGSASFTLVHPFEPYLLAVAALRTRGLDAYPAHALVPGDDGGTLCHPLIALIDLTKDKPLVTFDLLRRHPPMGSVEILSDAAALAATYAMLAETRISHLSLEMVSRFRENGTTLGEGEIHEHLDRISRMLFYCIKGWTGSHFVSRALAYLRSDLASALVAIDPAMAQSDPHGDPVVMGYSMMRLPSLAESTASNFAAHAEMLIGKRIKDSLGEIQKDGQT
ncbi:MAG: hypothetical protein U0R44_05610 [Candidatus Micrarchaeia archaeon]